MATNAGSDLGLELRIEGMQEIQKEADRIARDMTANPLLRPFMLALMIVTREARKNAPVDRGMLRASIVPEVVVRGFNIMGYVGSEVVYAPHQEFGSRGPYTPPWQPLYEWGLRKARGNEALARQLAGAARKKIMTVGLEGKHYLQKALEDSADRVHELVASAVMHIVGGGQ